MNKDVQIARLKKQLAEAKKQTKQAKADAKQAKKALSEERKKKDARTITLNKEQQQLLSKLLNDTPIQDF